MNPGSPEQKLEERFYRLIVEMDELLIASRNSPFACQALEIAREAIIALENRHAA